MADEQKQQLFEQLSELPDFLKHDNPKVREEALRLLKGCSSEEYLQFLRKLDILGLVIRLIKDTPMISMLAQTVLVNLATDEVLRERLIEEGVVEVVMDHLTECAKKGKSSRLLLMILTNISVSQTGISQIMQDGKNYMGLYATRLLTWLCNEDFYKQQQSRGTDDWGKVAGIVANLSQHESFRKIFIESNQKLSSPRNFLSNIQWQIRALHLKPTDPYLLERNMGIFRMFHNIMLDYDKHYYFVAPEFNLFALILSPILSYNDGILDSDDLSQMPNDIRVSLALPNKYFHPNNELRSLVVNCLLALCRNKPARKFLRASNIYYIIRELHKYEREVENEELDTLIDDELIHFFLLDEDDGELGWEEEQVRALGQLKRQSEGLALELEDDLKLDIDAQALKNVEDEGVAKLEPTEDGQIMDASRYNSERERLHALEEARQEAAIQARREKQSQETEYKTGFLDFL